MPADRKIREAVIRHAQADLSSMPTASLDAEMARLSAAPPGASVIWAAWRQGLKDLQAAVLGDWGGTHEEPGSIASPTQYEINQDRHQELNHHELEAYEHGLADAAGRARDRDRERGHSR